MNSAIILGIILPIAITVFTLTLVIDNVRAIRTLKRSKRSNKYKKYIYMGYVNVIVYSLWSVILIGVAVHNLTR